MNQIEFVPLCREAESAASDLLESACQLKELIEKRYKAIQEQAEEKKKYEKEVKREVEWAQSLATAAAASDIRFHISALVMLWELSRSPSNCKKILETEGAIESVVSFIEEEIDEKGRAACFGILCNVCSDSEARTYIVDNFSDLLTKAIIIAKNEIEAAEQFEQKEKQIVSFINNVSINNKMKYTVIEIGFLATLASSLERSTSHEAIDIIIQCCTSIISEEEGSYSLSMPDDELQYLNSVIMKVEKKTSPMISLMSLILASCHSPLD